MGTTGHRVPTASMTAWCARAVCSSQSRSSRFRRSAASPNSRLSTSPMRAASPAARSGRTGSAPTPVSSPSGGAAVSSVTAYSHTQRLSAAMVFTPFQGPDSAAQLAILLLQFPAAGPVPGVRAEPWIALPPVDADLPGGIERGDHQAQLDGEQFDIEQVDPDVTRDHDPLVEDPLQDVAEVGGLGAADGPGAQGRGSGGGQTALGHVTLPRCRRGRGRTA